MKKKSGADMGLKSFWKELTTIDENVRLKMEDEEKEKAANLQRQHVISLKICELMSTQSTFLTYRELSDEEIKLRQELDLYKEDRNRLLQRAADLEKSHLDKAIQIYESLVDEKWERTTIPYHRLSVIYRKQGRIDDEIRVLKVGLVALVRNEWFTGSDCSDFFLERLEKAIMLREKGNKKPLAPQKIDCI